MTKLKLNFLNHYYNSISSSLSNFSHKELDVFASMILEVEAEFGKCLIFGNGGSAAIASHVSVDLTKAASIRSVNYNEADLITCFANDFGYENWVSKAIEFYADPQDLVILISSSGNSLNMINAAKYSSKQKLKLITLTGFANDNLLRNYGNLRLWCDSTEYNVVETVHQIWLLSVVDYLIHMRNKV